MVADPVLGRAHPGEPVLSPAVEAKASELFERHQARVLAYCRRRLRSANDAEDALQTTYLYACRALERGVVPAIEIAWLLKIAHNVCLNHWGSARRRRELETVEDPARLESVARSVPGLQGEDLAALEAALRELTDLQRRAIVLREWCGYSYREIAADLGLSTAAVESLIFRARGSLAATLAPKTETRRSLVRCLDFGGLLSALKSATGLSAGLKLAASAAIGTALVAGSAGDTHLPAVPPPFSTPRVVAPPAQIRPAAPDPALAPGVRAAEAAPPIAPERRRHHSGGKGKERQHAPSPGAPTGGGELPQPVAGGSEEGAGAVEDVVEQTTDGVADTVGALAEGVGATVGPTVETLSGTASTTLDTAGSTLGAVTGLVDDTTGLLGGTLGLQAPGAAD